MNMFVNGGIIDMEELVTVIVTTHKRKPDLVMRAIKSVCSQTYSNLEIFVVDDSPKDYEYRDKVAESVKLLGDKRIIYIQNDENIGACASRNRAIKKASGKYIMYVDDDDEICSNNIELKISKFIDSNIGLVYSDCYHLDEVSKQKVESDQEKHNGKVFDSLILSNYVGAFPLIRKECFLTCGYFDDQMQSAQDYDMWLRIAQKWEIDYVDEPLAIVHIHQGERISTNALKKINGLERLNKKNWEYLEQHRFARHIRLIKITPYYAAAKQWKKGIKTLFTGIFTDVFDFRVNISHAFAFFRIMFAHKS